MTVLFIGEDLRIASFKSYFAADLGTLDVRLLSRSLEVFINGEGWSPITGVVWRQDFNPTDPIQRRLLELMQVSEVRCINNPLSILRYSSKLVCLDELRKLGVSVINQGLFLGRYAMHITDIDLPCVVKIGDYHGGFGKALVRDEVAAIDIADIAATSRDIVSIEKFIEYESDIRVLVIGDAVFAFERCSKSWKANHLPYDVKEIDLPLDLYEEAKLIKESLCLDIFGIDYLIRQKIPTLIELNLYPGMMNSNDNNPIQIALANLLHRKFF